MKKGLIPILLILFFSILVSLPLLKPGLFIIHDDQQIARLLLFTSIFASGLAMYILVKEFWGRYAGIVSAFFYILVPYRAIDVYIRGALAESFSFVWLPVILWSFYKLVKTNKTIYIYLSAVFLALLMI